MSKPVNGKLDIVVDVCRLVVPVDAPDRVLVTPWGNVSRVDGDSFMIDEEAAQSIVDHFNDRTTKTPFDYEHHLMGGKYTPPDGKAVAAGWITEIEVVPGEGIYTKVAWTAAAAEHIRQKEYRYLSPVFFRQKSDGKVIALHSVALTNSPAIENIPELVNKESPMDPKFERAQWFLNLETTATEGEIMTEMEKFLDQLREAIGAKEDTDQAGVLSALKAQSDAASEFRVAVCKAVDLDPSKAEKTEDIIAAVNSAKAPAKSTTNGDVVPKAQYEALVNSHKELAGQVSTLANRVNTGDADDRIKEACEKGLLTEHMLEANKEGKNHFRDLANKPDEWKAWLEIAPVVSPKSGRVVANSAKPAGPGGHRGEIIAAAKAEHADNVDTIACSLKEYVNEALREQDKDKLTDEETTTLAA